MSEFYFDYQCIAMNGGASDAAATDKALRFYLFQDYDSKAHEMCVQVYVPRDMQDKGYISRPTASTFRTLKTRRSSSCP